MDQPVTKPQAVRNLQRYLRLLAQYSQQIPTVPIDGIFESATADAVRAFQREYGLTENGRVNKETWDRIFAEYLRLRTATDRTPALNFFPLVPEGYLLAPGEESLTVSLLQLLLRELTVIYDELELTEISGRYDEPTERNVLRFQRSSLLPETGKVDLSTWNRILRDYDHYVSYAP